MPSTDSDTRDDGAGFLGDLDDSIERYRYKGKQQFIRTLDKELDRRLADSTDDTSEWVLFTGINEKAFARDFINPLYEYTDTLTTDTTSFSSYDSSNGLLLVKVLCTAPQAAAANTFAQIVLETLRPMDILNDLRLLAGSLTEGPNCHKAADNTWAPYRVPAGRSRNWPTVVLEVALTEPESKLSSDVRFWLHQSRGEVKIALTITVDRREPRILLEKWELRDGRRHCTQRVGMSMDADKEIDISGAPLVIEFEKLLLWPADSREETDITIDTDGFRRLATRVWEEQGFLEMGWLG